VDEREKEVRRRMDAQELYVDVGPGLEDLEESRILREITEADREFSYRPPRDLTRTDAKDDA